MKRIILLISICMLVPAVQLSAQDSEYPRNELGIGLVNLIQPQNILYPPVPYLDLYYPYYYYPPRPILGLAYKLHNDNGAWRLGLDFYFKSESNDNEYSKGTQSEFVTGLHSGYELHKRFKRVDLFYGADLLTGYSGTGGHYEVKDNNDKSSNSDRHMQIGFGPLVGVRYFITPNLSLSTETQFRMIYYQSFYTNTYNEQESSSFSEGFTSGFGPLGKLTLNVHF